MQEFLCSIHNYTKFSGKDQSFYDMAQAALACGLDVVFTTDRNIYPSGFDQFYYKDRKRVLVLCGEELSDPVNGNASRYLSLGIEKEQFNRNPAASADEIKVMLYGADAVKRFRHFELINAQELLEQGLDGGLRTIRGRINDFEALLRDDLRCVGLAGTCSAVRSAYSYAELFSTVCNHLITQDELTGDPGHDKLIALKALKNGNLFIALDGLSDAKGFRFTAEGNDQSFIACPGDTIFLKNSITFKINVPEACTCRLIRNGKLLKEWQQCRQVPFTIYEPGYYRVECAVIRRRKLCDWIFTNPIYVRRG